MLHAVIQAGCLAQGAYARVMERVQRPLDRPEQQLVANVFQGTAMVTAIMAGSVMWCTLRQVRLSFARLS